MRFLMVLCLLLMGASAFAEEDAMRAAAFNERGRLPLVRLLRELNVQRDQLAFGLTADDAEERLATGGRNRAGSSAAAARPPPAQRRNSFFRREETAEAEWWWKWRSSSRRWWWWW